MVWQFFFTFSKVSNQIKYEYFMYTKSTNFSKYIQYLPYCFWKPHMTTFGAKCCNMRYLRMVMVQVFSKFGLIATIIRRKLKKIRIIFSGHVAECS